MEQNNFARYRMAYLTSKFKVFKISMALVLCFTLFSINPALAQTLNAEQKKEVKSLIENYLQENPQVIVDAFRNFHKKSQANKNKNKVINIVLKKCLILKNIIVSFIIHY